MNPSLATPIPAKGWALFDFDGTLVRGESQTAFILYFLRRHPWRLPLLLPFLFLLPFRLLRVVGDAEVKRASFGILWNLSLEKIQQLGRQFAQDELLPRIGVESLSHLKEHQSQGLTCVLTSASPEFYLTPVGEALGMDHTLGTRFDLPQGTTHWPFIPKMLGPNHKGEAKIQRLSPLIPADRPLPNSFAYSDSTADLPLFRLVETPICVRPKSSLLKLSIEKQWKIIPLTPLNLQKSRKS